MSKLLNTSEFINMINLQQVRNYHYFIIESVFFEVPRAVFNISSFLFDVPRAVYRLLSLNTN